MMQRRIVDFGLSKYAWLSMKHDGVQYHARHQLKYGQLPSKKMWYKLESSLKRGIKSGKIAEAQ